MRAPSIGGERTAEELGRAFPDTPVRSSGGEHVLATVPDEPSIVVATPGAEPRVDGGGFAAVLLLDAWVPLARADLRAGEEAVRRWLNAAALVRPGGEALIVGDSSAAPVQAIVRWDPSGYAEREAAERTAAHLPPGSRLATVTGEPTAVEAYLEALAVPPPLEVLGPVDVPTRPGHEGEAAVRAVLRVPVTASEMLYTELARAARERSTRKLPAVRVQVDPPSL